ncbi:MAG: hypothetical protein HY905_27825 [Deltaproteobacteria bacterium]|nr:hypothetical protein [Deltaproteobacteria bacterium]
MTDAVPRRLVPVLVPAAALFFVPTLSTFQSAKALLAGPIVAALLLATRRTPGGRPRGLGALGPAFLLYLALSLPALFRAASPAAAAQELWFDLLFAGAALVAVRLSAAAAPRIVLVAVAAAAAAVAAVALPESFGAPLEAGALRGAGTMGNPDFTAAMVALGLPAAAWGLASAGGRARRATAAALALVLLAALVRLESLAAWVAAGAGLAALGLVALVANDRRRLAVLGAAVLALGAAAALAFPGVRERWQGRAFLANASLDAAAVAPLAGNGLGGFPRAYLDAQGRLVAEDPGLAPLWTRALHAHNEPLHVLVERGALGLAGLLAVWLALAAGFVRALRPRRLAGPASPRMDAEPCAPAVSSVAGLAGVAVAWVVLALAGFPGHLVPTQLVLGLLAGAAVAAGRRGSGGEVPEGAGRAPGNEGLARILADSSRAAVFAVGLALAALPCWLAAADALFVAGRPAAALAVNPWHGGAALAMGAAEQGGRAPTGCAFLERASRLAPSPAAELALGNCLLRRALIGQATAAFARAVRWNPRSAAAHGNLAVAFARAGDPWNARRHVERARSLRPGDKDIRVLVRRVRDATDLAGTE